MAEEIKATETEVAEVVEVETTEEAKPSYEELLKQLEEKDKAYAKLKSSFDKTSSDLATKKKELQKRMTDEEVDAEKRLANEKKLALYEAMERYTTHYPTMDTATARRLAELDADGDRDAAADVMNDFIEALVKQKSTEALLGRQRVNASANATSQITKEQFDKMNVAERSQLYKTNKSEYERLVNNK